MKILIADSGGTKTDWCIVHTDREIEYFTTESYHPVNWNEEFFKRAQLFWKKYPLTQLKMYFFGAGCISENNVGELSSFFKRIGFVSPKIQSDLHGAGYTALGKLNGKVAILGTGSVLFDWKNKQVKNIIGGKGHLLGDEGSAYYFGKLMLQKVKNNDLNSEQLSIIMKEIPRIEEVSLQDKYSVAQISFQLRNYKDAFSLIHAENIDLFIAAHEISSIDSISLVGSYASHHRNFIAVRFREMNVSIHTIVEKPIKSLVEQSVFFIE